MAVVARIAKLRLQDTATGTTNVLEWLATAAVQDTAAGSSVTVTVTRTVVGVPPSDPNTLTLSFYNDTGGTVRSVTLNTTAASQSETFHFTSNGQSGSATRAGTVEIALRATRTDATTYDVETDGTPNTPPATFSSVLDRGWIRGTTTATTTLNAASYAYPDTVTATTVLGAVPFNSKTLQVALGSVAVTSGSSSTATFTTSIGAANNRWPAASQVHATTTSFPNSSLTSQPWTTATVTETSTTIDPRLTFSTLLQADDGDFGTPPSSKHKGLTRLSSELGFLASRITNARGEGQNSITISEKLWDTGNLSFTEASPGESATHVTTTSGGEAGWCPSLMAWDLVLPGGSWTYKRTITNPSGATGLEVDNVTLVSLLAVDPKLRLLCGAGPTDDTRHFTAGTPFIAIVGALNVDTGKRIAMDAGSAKVALVRVNLATEKIQHLTQALAWEDIADATEIYFHPMTAMTGDAKVFKKTFTDTASWSGADIVVVGRGAVGGVPISGFVKEVSVAEINNHDSYKFDGAGFVGFPFK